MFQLMLGCLRKNEIASSHNMVTVKSIAVRVFWLGTPQSRVWLTFLWCDETLRRDVCSFEPTRLNWLFTVVSANVLVNHNVCNWIYCGLTSTVRRTIRCWSGSQGCLSCRHIDGMPKNKNFDNNKVAAGVCNGTKQSCCSQNDLVILSTFYYVFSFFMQASIMPSSSLIHQQ